MRWKAALFVVPLTAGLFASSAMLVDYTRPAPVFCSEGSACDAVRQTGLAMPFGVPMPAFGLLGVGVLCVLTLLGGRPVRALEAFIALLGAALAGGLIAAQAAMGRYCPYCMVFDTSICVLAGLSVWRMYGGFDLTSSRLERSVLGGAFAALPVMVLVLGLTRPVILPKVIEAEMHLAPKGRATVVEFVDFECPFCRDEYGDLGPILAANRDRIHVVRKLVPLTRIHPHALEAARAACCAEQLGQGDAMADALFHAPVDDLTPEGCARIAADIGIDASKYSQCIVDPKTSERIASDRQIFDQAAAKGDGLPLLWIGERKMMGLQSAEQLRRALDAAISKAGT